MRWDGEKMNLLSPIPDPRLLLFELHPHSRLIRRVMVLFPLFNGILKTNIRTDSEVVDGLPGSVEAILTLFFFVRRINGCNN